jgi:hypothetical protein
MTQLVPSVLEHKLGAADRVVYYESKGTAGPRFRLQGGERQIILVTHLVLADGSEFDPGREYQYGVHLELLGPDGTASWERDMFTKSRQSKADFRDGMWLKENTFSVEPGVQITDERLIRVTLPGEVPVGATLHAYVSGDQSGLNQGLMRAYHVTERGASDSEIQQLALSREERAKLLGKFTYLDWHELNPEQRRARVASLWERLPAVGEEGRDYHTRTVYVTSFRSPRPRAAVTEGWTVSPALPLAINVLGPAHVEIDARLAPIPRDEGPADGVLALELTSARGAQTQSQHDVLGDEGLRHKLFIPSGLHTLAVYAGTADPLVVTLQAQSPTVVHFGDDKHFEHMSPDGREGLVPDLRRMTMYPLLPELEGDSLAEPSRPEQPDPAFDLDEAARLDAIAARSVDIELDPRGDINSRVLRVRARGASAHFQQESVDIHLHYRFLDAAGNELEEGDWVSHSARQPFDRADTATGLEGLEVSRTADFRIIAPVGAASMVLTWPDEAAAAPMAPREGEATALAGPSERPALTLVGVYAFLPRETEGRIYAPPYDAPELSGTKWRSAPLETRSWYPILSRDHAQRIEVGQLATLISQVRIEKIPTQETTPTPQRPVWASLTPRGRVPRERVLEAAPERLRDSMRREWPASAWTSIPPGTRQTFRFDPPNHRRAPQVLYRATGDESRSLEGVATLNVGGEEYSFGMRSTRGRWTLDDLRAHRQMLSSASSFPGLEMFIDRPPASRSRLPFWWLRTIYRFGRRGITLDVVKPNREAYTVNLRVYRKRTRRAGRDAPELRALIDRGSPRRIAGVPLDTFTVADRRPQLDETPSRRLVFVDSQREGDFEVWAARVTIGSDIPPGRHRISIASVGRHPLWLRAFADAEGQAAEAATQWTGSVGPDRERRP